MNKKSLDVRVTELEQNLHAVTKAVQDLISVVENHIQDPVLHSKET